MDELLSENQAASRWLKRYFFILAALAALTVLVVLPVSGLWIYQSGDLAVDRAVQAQKQGFALYGSGLDADAHSDMAYKLALYKAREPKIVIAGSGGLASLRQSAFSQPMVNMAGTAFSLSSLRESLDKMLAVHKPEVVLLALDFWWFADTWEQDPFARRPARSAVNRVSLETLRMPLESLLEGRINLGQFLFMDFKDDRFGLRAQFQSDGYGPDGSWYAGSTLSSPRSHDAGFLRTLDRAKRQIGEFAPQTAISTAHLDALADIYFRLRGRGVTPVVFLSPLAGPVLDEMKSHEQDYPHLIFLRKEMEARGIPLADTSDARYLEAGGCEFLDGLHAGEVASVRLVRELTSAWHGLLAYVNMEQCNRITTEWRGHASVQYDELKDLWEVDFLNLGCLKKTR